VDASLLLDAAAAIRAAQTIASEVLEERIVERLLRIIVEMAGAERAVLVRERNGEFVLTAKLERNEVQTALSDPLTNTSHVATTIVRDVARMERAVVLADASRADRYARDPYILRHRPRSVLCFALEHAGRRHGIVYLENNATMDAFSPGRLEPLGIVGAQAAISMENARLYENLKAAQSELSSANTRLEEEVARQTKALEFELLGRVEAERSRNALSDEIIRVQNELLAELSVPLLPIAEGVMLVPIIGTMHAKRAAEVLETTIHQLRVSPTRRSARKKR
jgi:GAF domain-containing protein